jgi:putative transposase
VEPSHSHISVSRQCELLDLARSSWYYQPVAIDPYELHLMSLIDQQYTQTPFYGIRRMSAWLRRQGEAVNPKRVARLMRLMGIHAIYPKPHLSVPSAQAQRYPYLLKEVEIVEPNQVWSTDITYIRLHGGFVYLVAIIDWFSRYVLAWQLSNTMDVHLCLAALDSALALGEPAIFNTDQGSQFTSAAFTGALESHNIRISHDGRGRALDNVFVERLWRSVKYEEVYLNDYASVAIVQQRLGQYFEFYNHQRLHQALNYRVPAEVHFSG